MGFRNGPATRAGPRCSDSRSRSKKERTNTKQQERTEGDSNHHPNTDCDLWKRLHPIDERFDSAAEVVERLQKELGIDEARISRGRRGWSGKSLLKSEPAVR